MGTFSELNVQLDIELRLFRCRGIAQLVEQRSPKPRAEGSIPSAPAKLCEVLSQQCDSAQ